MSDSDSSPSQRQTPVVTIVVVALIAVVTGAQFMYPPVLEALRRNPVAFGAGEWWRLLSPLLVHADGWQAWVSNSVGIVLIGSQVERLFGRWRWLVLFLAGGLAGNLAGYAWEPYGAGASVGMFGLFGGLCAWLLMRSNAVWPVALVYGLYIIANLVGQAIGGAIVGIIVAVVLCGLYVNVVQRQSARWARVLAWVIAGVAVLSGIALAALHDNHGPAVLLGTCVAAALLRFDSMLRT